MRLIDGDACLRKAWENFYKQEEEHKNNIEGYDIMRDQFYEQAGFECCQQTIVNEPTVDAVPISVLEDIKQEMLNHILTDTTERWDTLTSCIAIIDSHISGKEG